MAARLLFRTHCMPTYYTYLPCIRLLLCTHLPCCGSDESWRYLFCRQNFYNSCTLHHGHEELPTQPLATEWRELQHSRRCRVSCRNQSCCTYCPPVQRCTIRSTKQIRYHNLTLPRSCNVLSPFSPPRPTLIYRAALSLRAERRADRGLLLRMGFRHQDVT